MNLKKLLKREIIITTISAILIGAVFFGVTYAIYKQSDRGNVGTIEFGEFTFQMCKDSSCSSIANLGNVITGELYPMSDEEGMQLSPYTFLANNNSDVDVYISVYATTHTDNTYDYSKVKLATKVSTDLVYSTAMFDEEVKEIKGSIKIESGESKIINVLAWGSEELSNEMIGKTFHIFVNAVAYYHPDEGGTYSYIANIDAGLVKGKEYNFVAPTETVLSPYQEFTAPISGYYEIEAWGAQGGSATYSSWAYAGGEGGYTSGKIYLTKDEQIYIYIGGMGESVSGTDTFTKTPNGNGYNGGTIGTYNAGTSTNNGAKSGGGGATDIRLVSGSWDSATSLNSRIMVAGGGGGASSHQTDGIQYSGTGGYGGNLIGGTADYASLMCYAYGTGGTQTSGGYSIIGENDHGARVGTGTFGKGCVTSPSTAISGGGGGYYGGGEGWHSSAGGGSSFISGYAGSAAIIEGSITEIRNHTTPYVNSNNETVEIIDTKHYSEKYFADAEMENGVREGNGKVKITYTGFASKTNAVLNNVRYIKDCINGNSIDDYNHWVELQAIANGTNVARGKVGVLYNSSNAVVAASSTTPISRVTDGDITAENLFQGATSTGSQCFVIDLGSEQDLDEVAVWHDWSDGITYNDNITSVAGTNGVYREAINTAEAETSLGKRANAYTGNPMLVVELGDATTTQTFEPSYAPGTTIILVEPTKANHIFIGWIVTGEGSIIDGNRLTMGTGATYLTPMFASTVQLTVNLGYGTTTQTFEPSYFSGTTIMLIEPTKASHTFVGWSVVGTGASINDSTLTFGTSNVTLTANWIETVKNYAYTGDVQEFTVPVSGYYQIETWGAQGGGDYSEEYVGGYGSYSKGNIILNAGEEIYVYVGGMGSNCQTAGYCSNSGGYNGGGNAFYHNEYTAGGGGATHVAKTVGLLSSLSNNTSSILMVSGGGGGAGSINTYYGGLGHGGGITGVIGTTNNPTWANYFSGNGGTQTSGGLSYYNWANSNISLASFGQGGQQATYIECCGNNGGGGGYYGGGASSRGHNGAGGGSGYIGNTNLADKSMYCYNCAESSAVDTFTVNTIGTSNLRDTVNCPNGYSDSAISKCAKSGAGYARVTYISQ